MHVEIRVVAFMCQCCNNICILVLIAVTSGLRCGVKLKLSFYDVTTNTKSINVLFQYFNIGLTKNNYDNVDYGIHAQPLS